MVAAELQRLITTMLGTPGSEAYEAAKEIVNDRPTLWDAVCAAGLTEHMDNLEKAETYWIFATMPDEMSDRILQRTRVALNAGLPIEVRWHQGEWTCSTGNHGEALVINVSTPVPDLAKLQSGTWFGTSVRLASI